jgi:sulfite reductase (NADPH) hemoprotein beta-component
MYRYDEFDAAFVAARTAEFKDQIARRLSGGLSEDEFRPLRLRNGLYLQLHAYMLRIAIPYGTMTSEQLRTLANIGSKYDRDYGHFTTRQNIQFNWISLTDVGEILDELAKVQMHAIQTSGNCIRNVTADHFAGVAKDEIADPRPVAELIRQWSTNHPEFLYLPRKFKIAVTGAKADRAAIRSHDIGIQLIENEAGVIGAKIFAGGGLGRTPIVGKVIKEFVSIDNLLGYLEAVLRVYNVEGRRDNKYKARIKILVAETGLEEFIEAVESEYALSNKSLVDVSQEAIDQISKYFKGPSLRARKNSRETLATDMNSSSEFANFVQTNTNAHKNDDYVSVVVSLKPIGGIPGDATSKQMHALADLADKYSSSELRVTHTQNIVLPNIAKDELLPFWTALCEHNLATANVGLISDIIACPGMDYCTLATARSINIAQDISLRFSDAKVQRDIGNLGIKISGCINACGHHHIGNIGILGLEKSGRENYQITIGGDATLNMEMGERLGPGIDGDKVPETIERIVNLYRDLREGNEEFIDTYRRIGIDRFRQAYSNIQGLHDARD